jgi:hypothetical protein
MPVNVVPWVAAGLEVNNDEDCYMPMVLLAIF